MKDDEKRIYIDRSGRSSDSLEYLEDLRKRYCEIRRELTYFSETSIREVIRRSKNQRITFNRDLDRLHRKSFSTGLDTAHFYISKRRAYVDVAAWNLMHSGLTVYSKNYDRGNLIAGLGLYDSFKAFALESGRDSELSSPLEDYIKDAENTLQESAREHIHRLREEGIIDELGRSTDLILGGGGRLRSNNPIGHCSPGFNPGKYGPTRG